MWLKRFFLSCSKKMEVSLISESCLASPQQRGCHLLLDAAVMEGRCFTSKAFCLLWALRATGPRFALLVCWSGNERLSPCSQEELGKYWRQKWIEKIIKESELHMRSQWRNIPTADRIRPSLATGRDKTAADDAGITSGQRVKMDYRPYGHFDIHNFSALLYPKGRVATSLEMASNTLCKAPTPRAMSCSAVPRHSLCLPVPHN